MNVQAATRMACSRFHVDPGTSTKRYLRLFTRDGEETVKAMIHEVNSKLLDNFVTFVQTTTADEMVHSAQLFVSPSTCPVRLLLRSPKFKK